MFNTLKHCVTISYCSTFIAMNSEKFSLKWNDFEANISKSFSRLRREEDFFDVTLISDDESKVPAHRVVLSSCSSFFKSI